MTRDVLDAAPAAPPSAAATPFVADAAVAATYACVLALFLVAPITLESFGVAYISSGGGLLSKFHPATGLAVAALALRCLAAPAPARTAWRLASTDPGVVLLLAAVVIAGVFASGVDRTPVTPLVDTFVLPMLVFTLLRDLKPSVRRWLATAVAVVLVLNAAIAITELLYGWRLIPITVPPTTSADPTRGDTVFSWQAELAEGWRATGLLGHPLVNGLVVGAFILCLAAPGAGWLSPLVRTGLIAVEALSMAAFGARAALVLTPLFAVWLLGSRALAALADGVAISPRRILAAVLAAVAFATLVSLAVASGLLDRTLERFAADAGSASTRLTMFSILEPISLADLLLRPDKDVVATWQRLYGLEFGIESSWLGLLLTYGVVVTAIVLSGLAAFSRSVLRESGPGAATVLVLFFLLSSVTASLSGKTTSLALVVALVMLFLPRSRPPLTARGARIVTR